MPKIVAKSMYNKLLRSTYFASIMSRFPLLCDMDCHFLDAFGNVVLTAPRQPTNSFVLLLHKNEETRRLLERNRHDFLTGNGSDTGDHGYQELVHRLSLESETIGYLMLSACRGGDEDREAARATWARLARQGSTVSWSLWSERWKALPELNPQQRDAWRQTLALYAHDAVRHLESGIHPEFHTLPSLVRQVCAHIRDHHTEPLQLKNVAGILGVSSEHLSRLFHQSTGLRFREYLAETRIEAACKALEHSDRLIAEIAYESGFSTLSRFNRSFKEHRNMTPRDWRRRTRRIADIEAGR